jgi:hypothetical protein
MPDIYRPPRPWLWRFAACRHQAPAARRGAPARLLSVLQRPLPLALMMAAVSIALQGFAFGVSNNIFHIPIVLRLYAMPQFAGDAYMQSLRDFVSPIYAVLALLADERSIAAWFFAGHVVARCLTFHALLRIVTACGVAPGPRLAAAAVALALCRCLLALSPVGADELLNNYFTHSDVAQALALYALGFLMRRALPPAALLAGLAFDLNAFVGFWLAACMALCVLPGLARAVRGAPEPRFWRGTVLAAGTFLALALPELLWIHAVVSPQAARVDYRAYLQSYYGKHFFLAASTWADMARDACMALSAALALRLLRGNTWHWLSFAALVGLFVLGAVTDPLSTSRFWLGLHLLRVDGLIALLAAALAVAAACRLPGRHRPVTSACAAGVLLALVAGSWPFCALSMAALAGSVACDIPRANLALRPAMAWLLARPARGLAVAGVLLGLQAMATGSFVRRHFAAHQAVPENHQFAGAWPQAAQWLQAGQWARHATPPNATFLVPPSLDGFNIAARRVTSMTWKQGGAVMWAPALYDPWRQAMRDIRALRSPAARLEYACRHGFSYVIEDLRDGALVLPAGRVPVYANRWFAAVDAQPCN